ncbi:MAG: NADP oxidoreductase [Mesorhizobium sp.]|nr:MAG: NADP oxidoreductase [Mesorhizobium sp.]
MPLRPVQSSLADVEYARIGIIGCGPLGSAIARLAVGAGMVAVVSNKRGRSTLQGFARELGDLAVAASVREAAQEEIVVLAVPWSQLPAALLEVPDWDGRIVIDATNPDIPTAALPDSRERNSSEIVSRLVAGAQLVKAFNTLPPQLLLMPPEAVTGRRVIFFSGDHARAKAVIGRMIAHLGLAGIDLGRLSEGGRLQQFPSGALVGLNLISIAPSTVF